MPEESQSAAPQPTDTPECVLTVRRSRVRVGGTARVHESVRQALGVEKRDRVEVKNGTKSVAVHLFSDDHADPKEVVLRTPDMKRLQVDEGAQVELFPWRSGREALGGSVKRFADRVARRLDLVEPETKPASGGA